MSEALEKVRQIVQRLKEIDAEREVLDAELSEIRKVMGVAAPAAQRKRSRPWVAGRNKPLRLGSMVHWAEKVIRHRGKPVYIDELVADINHLSGLKVQKTSLVSNLSRYVRSHVVFSRPSEGYYSLLELDSDPDVEVDSN